MTKCPERLTAYCHAAVQKLTQGLIQFGVALFVLPAAVPPHV